MKAWMLKLLRLFGTVDLLRYGVRDRILRAVFPPDRPRDIAFEVDFFGARYRGNFANYLDWVVFFFGAYEAHVLAFLRDAAAQAEDAVFVDVGANIGIHTLFMARHAHRVHAFEPYGLVRDQMTRKIADNRLMNVTVHPVALGERDEERIFHAPVGANTGTGTFLPQPGAESQALPTSLPIVNGDRYFASVGIDHVDLIKVDAEGFDEFVLKGLRSVMRRDRPIVLMEIDRRTRLRLRGTELHALGGERYRAFSLRAPRARFKFLSEPATRYHLSPFAWHDESVDEAVLMPMEKADWPTSLDADRLP